MKHEPLQTPIKVWYKALPASRHILWPIIDVKLSHQEYSLPQPLRALVDSGASMSLLHPLVADMLGFDLRKLGKPKAGGVSVSGQYKSWILPEPIKIDIYGYTFTRMFTVIDNPGLVWGGILGEDSIFEVARLDFQKFKEYFEIRFRSDIN